MVFPNRACVCPNGRLLARTMPARDRIAPTAAPDGTLAPTPNGTFAPTFAPTTVRTPAATYRLHTGYIPAIYRLY
jgi:hypothetical protein